MNFVIRPKYDSMVFKTLIGTNNIFKETPKVYILYLYYTNSQGEVYDSVADTLGEICTDTINGKFVPTVGQTKVIKLFDTEIEKVI